MYRANDKHRAGRPAEPLLCPFSRTLGVRDVVPEGPEALIRSRYESGATGNKAKQRLSPVCAVMLSDAQEGPPVQLQAGKARSTVQVQDVPAEERIAVQIRAR